MSVAQPVTLVGTGVLIGVFGVLIKYFGYVNLVAGYDPDSVTDEEGLANFVGTRVLLVALLTVAVGIAEHVSVAASDGTPWYWYLYGALVVMLGAWMIIGARRYEA